MSYQVLARKWRPDSFEEVVGQPYVIKALTHAINHNKLHHACLFTGTRGVGKTTLARIVAKCLNCEQGISANPCKKCSNCIQIAEGRFVDLIEVDAASKTKVEDTRELLENINYAPTYGRYKIYIIDEVHMLSNHSFNALLKTLEEPPPHIQFLLATTDPQKLPITVLSRCIQFTLNPISERIIQQRLHLILQQEAILFDEAALPIIAREAKGSMRDALTLADQIIAIGNGSIKIDDANGLLGYVKDDCIIHIIKALSTHDIQSILKICDEIFLHTSDAINILDRLLYYLHQLAIKQFDNHENIHHDNQILNLLKDQIPKTTVHLLYQLALSSKKDLSLCPDPKVGLEMALLRMLAFSPITAEITDETQDPSNTTLKKKNLDSKNNLAAAPPIHTEPLEKNITMNPSIDQHTKHLIEQEKKAPISNQTQLVSMVDQTNNNASIQKKETDSTTSNPSLKHFNAKDWFVIYNQLPITNTLTKQLISHCEWVSHNEHQITLALDPHYHSLLHSKNQHQLIEQALQTFFNHQLKLHFAHNHQSVYQTPQQKKTEGQQIKIEEAKKYLLSNEKFNLIQEKFTLQINDIIITSQKNNK